MPYKFTWDPAKAASNYRKHKVRFTEAMSAFEDPFATYDGDAGHPGRGNLIGTSAEQRLLFVVHVDLTEDGSIHIISARKADRKERSRYANRQKHT